MPPIAQPRPRAARFTVVVESVAADAWHLTVQELPETWTVAFSADALEANARDRIALDTGLDPSDFEITLVPVGSLFLERRANRRG